MKRRILALLVLISLLPGVGLAAGASFGPRLPADVPTAAGEEMAWQLLSRSLAAETPDEGIELVMKAATAAPENGDVLLSCAYTLLRLDPGGAHMAKTKDFLQQAVLLLEGPDRLDAVETLAQVLLMTDAVEEAVKAVSDALVTTPKNEALRLLLATTLYYADENGEALSVLEDLCEDSPRNLDALRLRATILLADCLWEEALMAYRQIEREFPEYLDGTYGLYLTYVASGQFDEALKKMSLLILQSGEESLWVDRARLHLWKRYDPKTALEEADALLRADGAFIDAMLVKLVAHLMLEDYEAADETADRIAQLDETYGALMRGVVRLNEEDYDAALAIYEGLAEEVPDFYVHWQYIALTRLNGYDDPEGARKAMAKAFALPGALDDYDMFVRLGHLYHREGNLLEAARAFAEANRLVGDDPAPLYALTMTAMDAGRREDMQDLLGEMERRYPGYYETMLAKALVLDAQGQAEEALTALTALFEKYPFPAETHKALMGLFMVSAGQEEGAALILDAIEKGDTPAITGWTTYAKACAYLEDWLGAETALQTAEKLLLEAAGDPVAERTGRIAIAVTRAETICLSVGGASALEALEEAAQTGWPLSAIQSYAEFDALCQTEGYKALLSTQEPQAAVWDLSQLPTIPE